MAQPFRQQSKTQKSIAKIQMRIKAAENELNSVDTDSSK